METLIPLAIPLVAGAVVYVITAGVKKFQSIKFSANKAPLLRVFAAVLAFGSTLTASAVTGQDISPDSIKELADVIIDGALAYFVATGIHDNRSD